MTHAPSNPGPATSHWAARMNLRNRVSCFTLLFLTFYLHLRESGAPASTWAFLVGLFFVYPHLAYRRALRASNPVRAEVQHFAADALLYGVATGLARFPVWITFSLVTAATVNLTAFRGWSGALLAVAMLAVGALLGGIAEGLQVAPDMAWPATLLCMASLLLYLLIVAEAAHARSFQLHTARMRMREGEGALQRQLEENRALQAQLREQANRDPMTGLYNRRFLTSTLARDLAWARRENKPLTVVIVDIDHFKRINDTWGHGVGDEVIKAVAAHLSLGTRSSDAVCRHGGEEFLVLMPGMPHEVALRKAELWRAEIGAQSVETEQGAVSVGVSIGVATFPTDATDEDALIAAADRALYAAKRSGRDRVVSATMAVASPAG